MRGREAAEAISGSSERMGPFCVRGGRFPASLGDLLSQPQAYGGLGLGTVVTSAFFLAVIVALVAYLSVGQRDRPTSAAGELA